MHYNSSNAAFIALGGNLPSFAGVPSVTLKQAIAALPNQDIHLERVSSLFLTPCFPAGTGPDYVNAVAKVTTVLAANALLDHLHQIEQRFERRRDARWGSRTLDLDLLSWGDAILPDLTTYQHWHDLPGDMQVQASPDRLILPHPRLEDRGFVLVPLAQIAPDWQHPVTGRTAAALLEALPAPERDEISELSEDAA